MTKLAQNIKKLCKRCQIDKKSRKKSNFFLNSVAAAGSEAWPEGPAERTREE